MRPIAQRPSPFDIRLTHEILQDRFRIEDLVDIAGQDKRRLIEILDEDLTRPHAAHHHLRQDTSGVFEVRSEIVGDGGLGLLDGQNRGCALEQATAAEPADRVAQRKRPPAPNLPFDVYGSVRFRRLPRLAHTMPVFLALQVLLI
jgi:hypothetical protein